MEDNQANNATTSPNVQELVRKATEIYDGLKSQLEPIQEGKYVAIEVDAKEHFIGETRDEAVLKGKAKFPDAVFFVKRIGGVDKVAGYNSFYNSRLNYARLF